MMDEKKPRKRTCTEEFKLEVLKLLRSSEKTAREIKRLQRRLAEVIEGLFQLKQDWVTGFASNEPNAHAPIMKISYGQ